MSGTESYTRMKRVGGVISFGTDTQEFLISYPLDRPKNRAEPRGRGKGTAVLITMTLNEGRQHCGIFFFRHHDYPCLYLV